MRSDQTVSQRTRDVIARAVAAGCSFIAVTGRPPRWMGTVADQVGHAGEAIVGNGAGVLDLVSMRLLRTRPISPQVGAEVVRRVTEVVPDAAVAGETGDSFRREMSYCSAYGDAPDTLVVARAEVTRVPLLKLLVRSCMHEADGLLEVGVGAVGELVQCTHSSNDGLLEISAAGVTKASTLAQECDRLGVHARDVIAFGDMPNDIAMLGWAGRSWAVADGHPLARAAAGAVCPGPGQDGVAAVLEQWF
jgi:hydroxymethylpyrimidine pyrophosphatase-like HAD family hydrolase